MHRPPEATKPGYPEEPRPSCVPCLPPSLQESRIFKDQAACCISDLREDSVRLRRIREGNQPDIQRKRSSCNGGIVLHGGVAPARVWLTTSRRTDNSQGFGMNVAMPSRRLLVTIGSS